MPADVRAALAKIMRATLADEAAHHDWTYQAVRPLDMPPRVWTPGMRIRGDCSKGCQYLCWWTPGAPDPMQNGWSHYGNSQTLWLALEHARMPSELDVGDIVTFGTDAREHATMVLERGNDPLLWSFGHQGAPNSYRLSQDRRVHQLCKLPIAPTPPTAAEKLQAKSGFYAWVAWRLGEGPWKHYGPMSTKVRPDVPTTISSEWWKRYESFLAARMHGNAPSTA